MGCRRPGSGPIIEPQHLPPNFGAGLPVHSSRQAGSDEVRLGVGTTVEEAERQLIMKTLESTHNNKTRAAEILGISLKTLHNKLKEYSGVGALSTESVAGHS